MNNLPSDLEIDSFNKNQILHWLRKLGKPTTGNKPELLERLKVFTNLEKNVPNPDIDLNLVPVSDNIEEQRKIFDSSSINWSDDLSKIAIPSGFGLDVIQDFLTSLTVLHRDEALAVGTEKPAIKGRRLYLSSKIQFCECGLKDTAVVFRCNIEASLKSEFR